MIRRYYAISSPITMALITAVCSPPPVEKKEKKMDLNFMPDWSRTMTPEEAEKELANFKFQQEGIYKNDKDIIIVIPVDFSATELYVPGVSNQYRFHVYNNRPEILSAFEWVCNAPVFDLKK